MGATFLLYRLIQKGNLVNVTSLLYFVPGVTALMDLVILGNAMSFAALAGMGIISAALIMVFRDPIIGHRVDRSG